MDTLRPGVLGKNRVEFAARYCGRRLLCSRPGRSSGQKHYDNSGVARPQELRGLLMKVCRSCHNICDLRWQVRTTAQCTDVFLSERPVVATCDLDLCRWQG